MSLRLDQVFGVNFRTGMLAVAFAAISAGAANAASFEIVGGQTFDLQSDFGSFGPCGCNTLTGTGGTIIGNNTTSIQLGDFGYGTIAAPANQIQIFYSQNTGSFQSANVTGGLEVANSGSSAQLTYTFLGFEAAYMNVSEAAFSYNPSTPMFINQSTPANTSLTPLTVTLGANGLVPFLFHSNGYGTDPSGTAVNGGPIGANVAIGFMVDPSNTSIAYAFFKDIWQGGDLDFDDIVVEIQLDLVDWKHSANCHADSGRPASLRGRSRHAWPVGRRAEAPEGPNGLSVT